MNTLFQCPVCGARHERLAADGIVPNPGRAPALCDACADVPGIPFEEVVEIMNELNPLWVPSARVWG